MSMKPGATMSPVGIEFAGARACEILSDGSDAAVFDRDVADCIETAGRVHHTAIANDKFRHLVIQFPRMRSSTAMRTAMPFSTWFRMTERCESATSEEISRPRLMGPGCITMASGLARLICSRRNP